MRRATARNELTVEEEMAEIKEKIASIEETQGRKFTQARANMLDKLRRDLIWLENGGVEPEEEEAQDQCSPSPNPAVEGPSPRSRALSIDPGLSEKVDSDRYNREAIAEDKWNITESGLLPKKALVVVWDFNNTLLPHYKMKRGTDEERALFEEWTQFTDVVQHEHLPAEGQWADVENVEAVGEAGADAARQVYEADCRIPAEELASLENDTEKLSDNWITHGRKALAYVQARGGLNVILTSAPLRATVAKLILFGMAKYVPLELVYSSHGCKDVLGGGKRGTGSHAIEAAKRLAGRKPKILIVGAKGKEEEELASMHRAKFHKIATAKELMQIKEAVGA